MSKPDWSRDESISQNEISCPRPHSNYTTIQMSHGSGGALTDNLIRNIFVRHFDNEPLNRRDDQATVEIGTGRLSFSTDSYVVDPIFFPGGNIGELAVNGTVNDICMNGARPLYLSTGFILEEGFALDDLERIVKSMAECARRAGVTIVTGDTKVVNRGKGDKIYINTSGVGVLEHDYHVAADNVQAGDAIILSGPLANHGVAVLSRREGLAFETTIESDTAALNGLVAAILDAGGSAVHAMRDPTRGGLAAAVNEWAEQSEAGITLNEQAIPVEAAVRSACELLGLDPLYIANEGRLVAAVESNAAENVRATMRAHPLGKQAALIGRVTDQHPGRVTLVTPLGAERIVDMPVGEQLPRIC